MNMIKQYEMKFFLNTSKSLTKAQILPFSYTWEITCKIDASTFDTGGIYQAIDEQISKLKVDFERTQHEFTPEEVANSLFERLKIKFQGKDLHLTYLRINSSPMIGYEILINNGSIEP